MTIEKKSAGRIVPVILAGGSGTRLWPLSRSLQPKQFHSLMDDESLLVATCRRVAPSPQFDHPIIICNRRHETLLARQLRSAGIVPRAIIFEPIARGTAAAAALATQLVARDDPQSSLLLLAADNYLERPEAFLDGVVRGARAAELGRIVVFGVAPTRAESGFGYIEVGEAIADAQGVRRVRAFVEKPDRAQAKALVDVGRHLWNSGNFLFRAYALLSEFERLRPDILVPCCAALDQARSVSGGLLPDELSLAAVPAESLDRAIMEHTDRAAVVPLDAGWSDVGTWEAVWSASAKDANGNSLSGDVIIENAQGCYIRGEGRLVAAVGLTDLIVIETADAVLVARRDSAAEVKALVERLEQLERPEARSHLPDRGSWGSVRRVEEDDQCAINRIEVNPGARVSRHVAPGRAEHWFIAQGIASIAFGDETKLLHQSESMHLQAGAVYHLQNMAAVPLHLIEIQTLASVARERELQ